MESATRFQILNEAIYVSLQAKALEKVMNLFLIPSAMEKIVKQTGFLSLCLAASLEEGKL